jgi:hypothetical protein
MVFNEPLRELRFSVSQDPGVISYDSFMKTTLISKNRIYPSLGRSAFFLISLLLACFALSPQAQAVIPPPDGGYPGQNTAEGQLALFSLDVGTFNTAVGWFSLKGNSGASFNTAVGAGTLLANSGDQNTATGAGTLFSNRDGAFNTADGALALFFNTTGLNNTAIGWFSLLNNNGDQNTAVGGAALSDNISGMSNTAVGQSALVHSTGSGNTALGFTAGNGVITADNVICIGNGVAGADVSNTTWVGNVYGVTTQSGTTAPVIVSDSGQLGTVASSERFKKDISAMDKASEAILSLRPVTFHYKADTKNTAQFGLIAEEVAKVNPGLVLPDKEGKPYTVRYDAVNAMLLNEFLKEHREVQELKKQIAALTAGLQKVSAQLELGKSAAQTALNNQ